MERGKADVFTLDLSDVSYMCQAHRKHVCAFKSCHFPAGFLSRSVIIVMIHLINLHIKMA